MDENPWVSVICSVKNGDVFISDTVQSILRQTHPTFDLTIVDDGSTDRTPAILERLSRDHANINIVTTDGVGRGAALNLAIAHSGGSLVANVDADDPSHPERLELQARSMENHPEIGALGTRVMLLEAMETPHWKETAGLAEKPGPLEVTGQLARRNPVAHSSAMIRRSVLERIGGYDDRRKSQFDYDLWVRIAAAGFEIATLPIELGSKRLHSAQHFERRHRSAYLARSAWVQARAVMVTRKYHLAPLVPARFVWGLVPNALRMAIRRALNP